MMEGKRALVLLVLSISAANAGILCPGPEAWNEDVFLLHEDCQKFYKCVFGQPIKMSCPAGLYFNLETSQCDWKANVDCPNDESDEEQGSQFLENGCPRNSSIHWLLPHEKDCNLFYTCISGRKLQQSCPGSLHFDFEQQICGWPKPEGCTTSKEDSSTEADSSENNPSKEDDSTEDDTKENISKEDDSKENISKEDDSKENSSKEDSTNEDSSSDNSSENNSSEGDTIEEFSEEDISKENDTNENNTEEDDTYQNVSKESVSNEDTSSEDDSSKYTSEENKTEETGDTENTRNLKSIEAIVDVNVIKHN